MGFLSTFLLIFFFGLIANFLGPIVLNLAGIPGAILAGKPGLRSKGRFRIGSLISAVGQSYVYLIFVAYVMLNVEKSKTTGFSRTALWVIAFLVCNFPISWFYNDAKRELVESGTPYANPQVEGLNYCFLICFIMSLVFSMYPTVIDSLWAWLPFIRK